MSTPTLAAPSTFDLDDDHRDFREVCRNFVAKEVAPRVKEAEAAGTFPAELWPAMAAAGLLGLNHPEEYGGSGGGVLALTILSEELAHASGGLAITPLVSSYMAGPHLSRYGNEEQKERWLRPLLAGEVVAAIAVTEPGAGSDVAGLGTTAKPSDGGFVLNGTKMFITNAGLADVIIVAAKTAPEAGHGGITTFLVAGGAEGMALSEPLEKLGWHASDTREVVFDDCFVASEAILGEAGRGFHQIMEAFQVERLSLAGMAVGLGQAALNEAVTHARERRAFGTELSKLQTIRHRLAKAQAELEAARTLTYQAAARWDSGHPEAATTTAQAKLVAPQIASHVVDEALQIFGGYGFIEETPVAMHYRDARILRIGGGTDEVQLEILAKRMGL
ncbi:MAG TPA: acyl-CoA dehydrogenase family protein [Solirubrobacterales bacterium]|nr:acyl-CoA dehydrogenase family protein [Solirubrobacterales bacterium]